MKWREREKKGDEIGRREENEGEMEKGGGKRETKWATRKDND